MSSKKIGPYIYKITYRATGQYYIGSHGSGRIIGDGYYTSSHNTLVRERFIKSYMNEWLVEIISEISNDAPGCKKKVAVVIENILIKKHSKDPLCLNGWYHDYERGHGIAMDRSNNKPPPSRKGAKQSEATKRRLSLQNTGYIYTPEQAARHLAAAQRNGLKRRGKPKPNHNPNSNEGLAKGNRTKSRRAPFLNAVKGLLKYLRNNELLKNPNTPNRSKKAILANRRRHIAKFNHPYIKHPLPK